MSTPVIDIAGLLNSFIPIIALVLVMTLLVSVFKSVGRGLF